MNQTNRVPEVDAKTAFAQFQSGQVRLLDVREPSEWELGHIEGAALIPMSQLGMRWRELDASVKWVCVLRQAGLDIANMTGGMLDWKENKLPITPPGIVESH